MCIADQSHRFGPTTVAKVRNSTDLGRLLDDSWLESETIIVKPNWVSREPADFTDAATLRMLFEALDSQFVVVESHMILRSMKLLPGGKNFVAGDKEVNWKWLLKGEGWNWLIENPDWEWFKKDGHWEQIKEEERAFLDDHGFSDLFTKYGVTYVNVTDEVWSGRIADPGQVKMLVESRFNPVRNDALYSMVPQKLYDLRESTFVSLARLKMYASLTMKNLFGLIPDPLRPWWHGPGHSRIAASIVDINKIYQALFNVFGICESINVAAISKSDGQHEGVYTGKYDVGEGLGVMAFGRDLVSLDRLILGLTEQWVPQSVKVNLEPTSMAEEQLGTSGAHEIEEARRKVGNWFVPVSVDINKTAHGV